jgi:hypothetical protein
VRGSEIVHSVDAWFSKVLIEWSVCSSLRFNRL